MLAEAHAEWMDETGVAWIDAALNSSWGACVCVSGNHRNGRKGEAWGQTLDRFDFMLS